MTYSRVSDNSVIRASADRARASLDVAAAGRDAVGRKRDQAFSIKCRQVTGIGPRIFDCGNNRLPYTV
jgi:hypothetical protein